MQTISVTGPGAIEAPLMRRRPRPQVAERLWSVDVLVVEDDAADASLIESALRRDTRVRNIQVSDAPDDVLFELATGKVRPNLILLDIHMPRLNGFKFLEALRRVPALADTPVVFLTTSRLSRDVQQARMTSVNTYIVKPDTFAELKARLASVVEQTLTGVWSR